MKSKYTAIFVMLMLVLSAASAVNAEPLRSVESTYSKDEGYAIGLLHGGSGLGFDYEKMLSSRLGLQLGAGITGFGAGINLHFRPSIRSPGVWFGFLNQGGLKDSSLIYRIVGSSFFYRHSKRRFTWSIGLGYIAEMGKLGRDAVEEGEETPILTPLTTLGVFYSL